MHLPFRFFSFLLVIPFSVIHIHQKSSPCTIQLPKKKTNKKNDLSSTDCECDFFFDKCSSAVKRQPQTFKNSPSLPFEICTIAARNQHIQFREIIRTLYRRTFLSVIRTNFIIDITLELWPPTSGPHHMRKTLKPCALCLAIALLSIFRLFIRHVKPHIRPSCQG